MSLSRVLAVLLIVLCPGLNAIAGGKKGAKSGISFHLQAERTDNPKMVFVQPTNGEQVPYRRNPEIMTKDLAAFDPFPSQDGEGYGAKLQLKPAARNRLAAITNANVNRWLLAMVNGRVVDAVIIDRQIDDGFLVIWKGIGKAEIDVLDSQIPRIGEKKPRL